MNTSARGMWRACAAVVVVLLASTTITRAEFDANAARTHTLRGSPVGVLEIVLRLDYDARNRLTGHGTATYTWTARGTLASVQRGLMSAQVEHDALGRLTSYGSTDYTYDALDRIATRDAQSFTYAGTEIDPVGRGAHTYARDPSGELIAWSDGAADRLAGRNRHGDLAWLADASGAVRDSRVWDPYGALAGSTGTAAPAVGYQSDYTDPSSAMVWMGARWYDPVNAAFAERDPVFGQLVTPFTLNRYTYAQGDPLEFFDPDGRWGLSSITSLVGSVITTVATAVYNYVIRPIVRTVSSAARAVASTVATVARTARRYTTAAVQRITTTTAQFASKLASKARDTADAISSATGKLNRGLKNAAGAVGRCFNGLSATCTQIAVDVGVGLAVGALCVNTAGLGCAAVAGAAGGAAANVLACGSGELLRCAAQGAAFGAAGAGVAHGALRSLSKARGGQWWSRSVTEASEKVPRTVALDSSAARALTSADQTVARRLESQLAGCNLVMCETAAREFQSAVARLAGPSEKEAAAALMRRVTVVADNPSARVAGLNLTRGVGSADIQVFGTADRMGIPIVTSDLRFLRAAAAQGVDLDAIVHPPVSFWGF